MLKLPRGWRGAWAGWAVTHIFQRLSPGDKQMEFARALIPASLDLMAKSCFVRYGKTRKVIARSRFAWSYGKLIYRYLPVVNNRAVYDRIGPKKKTSEFTLIVPPDFDSLLRDALRAENNQFEPYVHSIGDFISWRMLFAPLDLGITSDAALFELLAFYNTRATENGLDAAMHIKIPKSVKRNGHHNRRCARCKQCVRYSGDWYGELCPECADATDGIWVCEHCGREGNFEVMGDHGTDDPICCGTACKRVDPDD